MDFWGLFWQILAYGSLILLLVVIIFAIIEPGPLQNRRTFGRRQRDEEAPDSGDDPSAGEPEKER